MAKITTVSSSVSPKSKPFGAASAGSWDFEWRKRWEPVVERTTMIEEVMKWPCKAARIFGFWPFFISENNKLHFRWLSSGTLLSLCNFIVVLVFFVVFFLDHDNVFVPVDSDEVRLSSTETAGFIILGVSQALTTLALIITILVTRHKIASVWNNLSETAEMICQGSGGHAGSELQRWIRKATKGQKALILFLLAVSTVRNLMELWPILEHIFELRDTWKTVLYTVALVTWSVISDMQTTFLLVFVGFVDVLTICFRVLSYQAGTSTQAVALQGLGTVMVDASSPSLRSLTLAHELEKLTEELNEKLKIPMVGIVVSTIVTLTVSIFFTATFFSRWTFEVGNLSLLLSIIMYLIHLHVLCSTGSTFILEAQNYGAALERVDTTNFPDELSSKLHRQSMKFEIRPPVISPGRYYVVDNQLMSSIIAVLTSYSIVLIQFNKGDKVSGKNKPVVRSS